MTPQEMAARLRPGGVALAFDANALFGEGSLFAVCSDIARHNEHLAARGQPPVRLVVSTIAHTEKLFDLKQEFQDRFASMTTWRVRVPKGHRGLEAQRCVVVSFELLLRAIEAVPPDAKLRRALEVVEESLAEKGLSKDLERRVLVVDHRVIWMTPIKVNGTLLFWELLAVALLQAELAASEVSLRGALAIGDVQVRRDFAAGPGLQVADRLRDDVAVVPRVVVPPDVLVEAESSPFLRARHHMPMDDLGYIRGLLRLDADGVRFVDYLAMYCREAQNAPAYLEGHRRFIERRLDDADRLDRESRAWAWLWSYHNRVVDELHEQGHLDDDAHRAVRIPAKSPLVYTFPLDAKIRHG